jgi:hypothetical protein
MALQINLADTDSGVGVAAPMAYVRIVIYTHDIKSDALSFAVEYHYNQQARNQGRNPIKGASYAVLEAQLVTTGNIRVRMYDYLKTLPEFTGAIDV